MWQKIRAIMMKILRTNAIKEYEVCKTQIGSYSAQGLNKKFYPWHCADVCIFTVYVVEEILIQVNLHGEVDAVFLCCWTTNYEITSYQT